ncbi:LexA family protein [Streptomyces sp. NPDC056453]|uniref:LexA family protein n=1 Tax=Streptomyces sp. NPDC056453 TaxID=3345822 RepID=UPI0036A2814E
MSRLLRKIGCRSRVSNAEPPVVSGGSEGRGLSAKAMRDRPGAGRKFRHVIGCTARSGHALLNAPGVDGRGQLSQAHPAADLCLRLKEVAAAALRNSRRAVIRRIAARHCQGVRFGCGGTGQALPTPTGHSAVTQKVTLATGRAPTAQAGLSGLPRERGASRAPAVRLPGRRPSCACRDVIANTGGAPTVREISQRVGLSSSGSVAYQLAYLEKLSVISRNGRHWRSSRLTGQRSARTGRHCRGNPAQGLSGVSVSSPVTLSLATGAHLPGSMKARKYSGLHS